MTTSTASPSTRTSRTMPRSTTETAGISGSGTRARMSHTAFSLRDLAMEVTSDINAPSPLHVGIGALHVLKLGQDIAHIFAVPAAPPAGLHPAVRGAREGRFRKHLIHRAVPRLAQAFKIDADPERHQAAVDIVHGEQLARIGPQLV